MFNYDKKIIPKQLNPILTQELQDEVNFFLKWGYLIIDDAITKIELKILRAAFDDTLNNINKLNHIDVGLLEYDERFIFLLDNNPVIKRIEAILGCCIQLHSATARVTEPNTPNQNWHRDGPWPVDPEGTPYGSIPGQINCGYYLDELTEENGPIAVVPGSHKALFKPPSQDIDFPDQKLILAKPGQAIIFNGWLYHRGLENKSKSKRRVCLMCYQNSWMKSRETFDGPVLLKLKNNGTDLQKLLLGEVDKW
jgi:ectoine hydroxylase-related dioxygenase (phytanoyl-CoA dioxygenase family)